MKAYEELYRWLADNGYDPAGSSREIYLSEDGSAMEILVPYQEHDPGGM